MCECCYTLLLQYLKVGFSTTYQVLNVATIVMYTMLFVMQIYHLAKYPDQVSVLQYLPATSGMLYVIVNMLMISTNSSKEISITSRLIAISWPIKSAGPSAQQEILSQWNRTRRVIFACAAHVLAVAILCLFFGTFEDILLFPLILPKYVGPIWGRVLMLYTYYSMIHNFYGSVHNCMFALYVSLKIRTQFYLIGERIRGIDVGIGNLKECHNEMYQEEIKRRLCFCIDHHRDLKRTVKEFASIFELTCLLLFLLGIVTEVVVIFLFLDNGQLRFITRMRLIWYFFLGVFVLGLSCEAGENIYAEGDRICEEVMSCPWYDWNRSNRQSLMIFATNSRIEPLGFYHGSSIKINFKMALGFTRMVYSVSTIVYKFTASRQTSGN